MRSLLFSLSALALFAGVASAEDSTALEQQLTTHPERFREDIDRRDSDHDARREAAAAERAAREAVAEAGNAVAEDGAGKDAVASVDGEASTWGDGARKDARLRSD